MNLDSRSKEDLGLELEGALEIATKVSSLISLTSLLLRSNYFIDDCIEIICSHLTGLHALTLLDLSQNSFGVRGARSISTDGDKSWPIVILNWTCFATS